MRTGCQEGRTTGDQEVVLSREVRRGQLRGRLAGFRGRRGASGARTQGMSALATSQESLHLRPHVPFFNQLVCLFVVLVAPPKQEHHRLAATVGPRPQHVAQELRTNRQGWKRSWQVQRGLPSEDCQNGKLMLNRMEFF